MRRLFDVRSGVIICETVDISVKVCAFLAGGPGFDSTAGHQLKVLKTLESQRFRGFLIPSRLACDNEKLLVNTIDCEINGVKFGVNFDPK